MASEEIEVTYTAMGFEETSFSLEVSEKWYRKLDAAEADGELLDSDYISDAMPRLHKLILESIRQNMIENSLEPGDGLVEKTTSWGATYREHSDAADHSWMDAVTDDADLEYSIDIDG